MAASVGRRCLRLLCGVAPWRSRYSFLGRLSRGGRRPGPSRSVRREKTFLFCGLPEEGSGKDSHPPSRRARGQVRLPARREVRIYLGSVLSALALPFLARWKCRRDQTKQNKTKTPHKKTRTNETDGIDCVPSTRVEAGLDSSFRVLCSWRSSKMWEELWTGSRRGLSFRVLGL